MIGNADARKLAMGLFTLGGLVFAMLISIPSDAQVAGGTITGTVSDTTGAVIPKAELSVKNVGTDVATAAVTNSDGLYTVPNLLPGTYEVTISAAGFKTEVRSGITLTVGAEQVLNVTMQVGQTSQTVQVTGEAAAVQLASSTISGVVNSNTVRELPLNGRDWASLAALQAGASAVSQMQTGIAQDGGNQRSFRGFGNQITISGARPQQNNYRVDGISINDYTNGGPGSVAGVALGVDAIQEFSVLTSNYTAEYGKTSGGVVNAISRSGTNQFHGDAFEFLRNNALDAANFFDNFTGTPIPPFKRNQFGGAAGGPIRKDRTFFFGSYEGFRQTLGLSTVSTVPSLDARNGIIHNDDGTTCTIGIVSAGCSLANSAGTVGVDPLVAPYLGFWHAPNGRLFPPGNTGVFSFAGSEVTHENFVDAHVDHRISEKDSLFGTWQYDVGNLTLPDNLDDVLNHTTTGRQLYMVEETHVFSPQLVNSVRAGYNRSVAKAPASATAINPLAADTALGTVPGLNAPEISVSGLGTMFSGGVGSVGHADWVGNFFQAYDDAFLTKGIHGLKFGFAFERQQCNCFNVSALGTRWKFSSLTNFLTNVPSSVNGPLPGHYPERGWRDSIFGAYVQDDIRWRPNLTVNLGLRYEPATVFNEIHGYSASLHDVYTDTTVHLGSPLFSNPTHRNFEPRVGFAWDPFRNGKTSVRGGFGVFDMLPLMYQMQNQEQATAPWILNGSAPKSALVQGSFPVLAFQSAEQAKLLRVSYLQQNPSTSQTPPAKRVA
jgi:Carboxypeptidase regulatory-like domain/TonB dependent receptor-like, beta-barrel/TonB-dependent Receptor Plug Domain